MSAWGQKSNFDERKRPIVHDRTESVVCSLVSGLFLLFAIAFGVDALTRFMLGLGHPTDETEPVFYMGRLATFALIAAGIVLKNRPNRAGISEGPDPRCV